MWGRVLDWLRRFRLIFACCKSLYHNWKWKYLSTLHSPAIKWFYNFCITLSALFDLWLLVGNNEYLMFMVVIFTFIGTDASFPMKWRPGWILRLFKFSVKDAKALSSPCRIYSALLYLGWNYSHTHTLHRCFWSPWLKRWANFPIDLTRSYLFLLC